MNGTVAPALERELRARGGAVFAWDRAAVPLDDDRAVERHIREVAPTALAHCGTGDPRWAELLATCCAQMDIRFLFTSSVSVFGPHQSGPHSVNAVPEPCDDYGRYKLECERRVIAANPSACIVRLGWQIALRRGGNQMVEHFTRRHSEQGHIGVSTAWIQACSFLEDTARVLSDLLASSSSGLHHLDGNPGWDMHRIVCALNQAMSAGWDVRPTADICMNNLMRDDRLQTGSIAARLNGG